MRFIRDLKMEISKPKILIVDDEEDILFSLKYLFDDQFDVFTCNKADKATIILQREEVRIVITDQKMAGTDGITFLKQVKKDFPQIIRILMTGYSEMEVAISAINEGDIFHYVQKPWDPDEFRDIVKQANEKYQNRLESDAQISEIVSKDAISELMGPSSAIKKIATQLNKVSSTNFTVLLIGESGTGKEVLCNSIKNLSLRKNEALISINCGAIPENLIESELFGHEKGSFTGAHNRKIGLIEAANDGTLFLDEIGELPFNMQAKLLRVLQERKIRRVGGNNDIDINVRFIAATNQDLSQMIDKKEFRSDLYYRIAEYTIDIPPLRKRKSDILFLAEKLMLEANQEMNKETTLSKKTIELLINYDWPGNVRELRNIIRKAVLLADDEIQPSHLDIFYENNQISEDSESGSYDINSYVNEIVEHEKSLKTVLDKHIEGIEKEIIIKVLEEMKGNKSKASKILQVDYKTLYNKIKKYGL